jgi:soluble lytic murein transglycosylase-like protein
MRLEDRYDSLIKFYSEKYNLDWLLIKAQIKQESQFNPDAKSKVGAKGLSQFMERTWEEWKDGTPGIQPLPKVDSILLDPRDPEDVIRAQCAYMDWILKNVKGDFKFALASYNYGTRPFRYYRTFNGDYSKMESLLPGETQYYVRKIMNYYSQYKNEESNAC